MKNQNYNISDLSSHIFWDTDRTTLRFNGSERLIINRVLEYGVLNDWKLIKKVYGLQKIKEIAVELRTLDDVTVAFLCTIFHLEKKDFRCYRLKQSTESFWSY